MNLLKLFYFVFSLSDKNVFKKYFVKEWGNLLTRFEFNLSGAGTLYDNNVTINYYNIFICLKGLFLIYFIHFTFFFCSYMLTWYTDSKHLCTKNQYFHHCIQHL